MFYRSLRLLALALSLGPAFAAAPPDWLLPHLSPEARAWKMSEPATALIDSTECRQLTADRVQYHAMGAILVHNPETGGPKAVATLGYSTDKTKITDVRAWVINPAGKATAVGRSQFSDIGVSDPRFWIGQRMLVYKPDEPMPNGSILAWEFSYESNTGPLDTIDWRANNLPTRQAKIQVVPLPDTILSWHAYNPRFPAPAIDPVTHRHV